MAKITAPFTPEQVVYLEIWQQGIGIHPFTCLHDHDGDRNLIPTERGWTCPQCSYTQDWCHDYMCSSLYNTPISNDIDLIICKQQLIKLSDMLVDYAAARLITEPNNEGVVGRILREQVNKLSYRIGVYEFSSTGATPSSKEDPSLLEGNGD